MSAALNLLLNIYVDCSFSRLNFSGFYKKNTVKYNNVNWINILTNNILAHHNSIRGAFGHESMSLNSSMDAAVLGLAELDGIGDCVGVQSRQSTLRTFFC